MILWAYVFSGVIILFLSILQYHATMKEHGMGMIMFSIGWIAALIWSGMDLI